MFLAKDQIWSVRRAVAKGLVAMSDVVDQESRKQLVPVFLDLAEDKIRWVRNEARYESGYVFKQKTPKSPSVESSNFYPDPSLLLFRVRR